MIHDQTYLIPIGAVALGVAAALLAVALMGVWDRLTGVWVADLTARAATMGYGRAQIRRGLIAWGLLVAATPIVSGPVLGLYILAPGLTLLAFRAARWTLQWLIAGRERRLRDQLVPACVALGSAARAGSNLFQAIEQVAGRVEPPLRVELDGIVHDVRHGAGDLRRDRTRAGPARTRHLQHPLGRPDHLPREGREPAHRARRPGPLPPGVAADRGQARRRDGRRPDDPVDSRPLPRRLPAGLHHARPQRHRAGLRDDVRPGRPARHRRVDLPGGDDRPFDPRHRVVIGPNPGVSDESASARLDDRLRVGPGGCLRVGDGRAPPGPAPGWSRPGRPAHGLRKGPQGPAPRRQPDLSTRRPAGRPARGADRDRPAGAGGPGRPGVEGRGAGRLEPLRVDRRVAHPRRDRGPGRRGGLRDRLDGRSGRRDRPRSGRCGGRPDADPPGRQGAGPSPRRDDPRPPAGRHRPALAGAQGRLQLPGRPGRRGPGHGRPSDRRRVRPGHPRHPPGHPAPRGARGARRPAGARRPGRPWSPR